MLKCLGNAIGAIVLLASILPGQATAEEKSVGIVKLVYGTATVTRGGSELPATRGMKLLEQDVLKTAADGTLGVILKDDTLVSLGPGATVTIARFAFAPEREELELNLRVTSGKVIVRDGKIAKISPKAVRMETPSMIIGVRGTSFAMAVS